jgi:hypothetical protein
MKTKFSSHREVCAAWVAAHRQGNESAWGSGSNIRFDGPVIYSYGHHFPMARFTDSVILFTTRTYGAATAKHLNRAHSAARATGLNILDVYDVRAETPEQHQQNFLARLETAEQVIIQAKKAKHWESRLDQAGWILENLQAYMIVFWVRCVEQWKEMQDFSKQVRLEREQKEHKKAQALAMKEHNLTERDGRQAPCFVRPEKVLVTAGPESNQVQSPFLKGGLA